MPFQVFPAILLSLTFGTFLVCIPEIVESRACGIKLEGCQAEATRVPCTLFSQLIVQLIVPFPLLSRVSGFPLRGSLA